MSDDKIRIAIIGSTRAGKTSFLAGAKGLSDSNTEYNISGGGDSCTKELQICELTVDGKVVELIDTPGFQDSDNQDLDIFFKIAGMLGESRNQNKLFNGIIYMEGLEGARVKNELRELHQLVKKIIEDEFMKQVVVAGSQRDNGNKKCEEFETIRRQDMSIWGDMEANGANVVRFWNTTDSAIDVIRHFLDPKHFPASEVLLQKELVANYGQLRSTSAEKFADQSFRNSLAEDIAKIQLAGSTPTLKAAVSQKDDFLKRLWRSIVWIGEAQAAVEVIDFVVGCIQS